MTFLLNRQTGLEEPAQLVNPIEQEDLDCYHAEWRPILDGKIAELKRLGQYTREGVAQHNVEDAHWQWADKKKRRVGQLQYQSFAMRADGRTQGLMYLDLIHRCRLPAQQNEHMIYIEFLSTAPWNRSGLATRPLYRGVGGVLMTEAILQSIDEGFGGRIGLHSLPRAEKFYQEEWGMKSLGPDPKYDGLIYFEMTAERAAEFLSQ